MTVALVACQGSIPLMRKNEERLPIIAISKRQIMQARTQSGILKVQKGLQLFLRAAVILSDPCVCAELSGIARGQTLQVAGRKHIKLYMAKGCFGFRHCCFERYQIASYVTCRDNDDCTINLLYTSLVSNLNPKSISDETAANKRFSLSKTLLPPVETTFGHIYLE